MSEQEQQNTHQRLVKIGELLISVGALSSGDLTEAIQIATRMGVPIGRVLVMSGCVSENNLQQALELQSLIKDNMVDIDTGKKALSMVFKDGLSLQQALKNLNWQPKQDQSSNKLGDLLIDSNIVTAVQLDRALEASFQSGMPLGGTLVLQGVISAQLLPTILHVQEKIREGKMPREDALGELKLALMFWAKADQSKQEELQGAGRPAAQAAAQAAAQPAGQQAGRPAQAAATPAPPAPALRSAPPPAPPAPPRPQAPQSPAPAATNNQVSLVELLKLSGHCTQASLEKAIADALEDSRLASKVLLALGVVDSGTLNNYVHVQALIARGKLRTDQALYVLNSIRNRKMSLDEALNEMGVAAAL